MTTTRWPVRVTRYPAGVVHPRRRLPLTGVRLGALGVALAALIVFMVPNCHGAMTMGGSMPAASEPVTTEHVTTAASASSAVPHTSGCSDPARSMAMCAHSALSSSPSLPDHPNDVVMLCVVLLLCVVAGALGLMSPGSARVRARIPNNLRPTGVPAAAIRPPSLAELCVLRT